MQNGRDGGAEDELAAGAALLRALASPLRLAIVVELQGSAPLRARAGRRARRGPAAGQPAPPDPARGQGDRGSKRGREVEYRLADDHVSHIALDAITHANEQS